MTLLEAVLALALPHAGVPSRRLTVSCGAAAFAGMDDLYNPAALTRRAEEALEAAKAAGGRKVRACQEAELLEV